MIAVYLRSNTQQHSNRSIGGSPHECDWGFSIALLGRVTGNSEVIGSSVGLVSINALVVTKGANSRIVGNAETIQHL